MTLFARNPDTGMASWAYQYTPFDEWDYDGINEPVIADIDVGGSKRNVVVEFNRNGFAYTLDRKTGELLVAEKYDPAVNWATKVDMDKAQQDLWSSARRCLQVDLPERPRRQHHRRLPGRSWLEG